MPPSTGPWKPLWEPCAEHRARSNPGQPHRTTTSLELLFDLCFVIAVAQASASLSAAVSGGHYATGALHFALVFFTLWWAWMNFTWFASAYDPDDVPYRLAVLLQITGSRWGGVLAPGGGRPGRGPPTCGSSRSGRPGRDTCAGGGVRTTGGGRRGRRCPGPTVVVGRAGPPRTATGRAGRRWAGGSAAGSPAVSGSPSAGRR
ncbi:hypothetical protein DY245_06070 [Streptomyces inhibens]|uniref:Low temperature requirement protein A n=1 Tax=Streptomyces inhibens TaxID=2293571 RepID=A0A371Q8X5_STRIH|nr:hypothetical protein DY245_06070 [Streptomyces inhibens]